MSRSSFSPAAAALFVLLTISWPGGAPAGGREPFEPIDAEALIDACWAISREDRDSGVTARMRSGGLKTGLCLEDVIVSQAKEMFETDDLERIKVREKLDQLRNSYGGLYWSIYNEHNGCSPCGTHGQVLHVLRYATLLESMIRDIVEERNDLRF